MGTVLMILNESAYGSERTSNGLRLVDRGQYLTLPGVRGNGITSRTLASPVM